MKDFCKEAMDFLKLKIEIVKLLSNFMQKHAEHGNDCHYQNMGETLSDVLVACLSEVQYLMPEHPRFTSKQIDHICYQIGKWYLAMKPLLEGQHNLGHMKEKLKTMICGDE